MAYRLAILDVSPFIYKAMAVKELKSLSYESIPTGGITLVMRHTIAHLLRGDDVALVFDSKSFRKDIDGEYKKGRPSRPDVYVQLDLLYNLLKQVGFPVFKEDGMEADDLIYTIVETLGHNYVEKEIYSTDYDLIHNIDDNGTVKFIGISSLVKDVSKDFYNPYKNVEMPFNTKTPRNILVGDGDFNKSFKLEDGRTGAQLYKEYVDFVLSNNIKGSDSRSKLLLDLFMDTKGLSEKDRELYEKRCRIFYPELCKECGTFPATKDDLKNEDLIRLLSNLKLNSSLTQISRFVNTRPSSMFSNALSNVYDYINISATSNQFRDVLSEYNKKYITGSYMVDNNITVNEEDLKKPELNLAEVLEFSNSL